MWMVVADVAALLATPALDGLTRRSSGWSTFLTDLSRVGLAGLVLLELVPHGWHTLGPLALGLFVAGAVVVVGVERWAHGRSGHTVVGGAAVLALVAHHVVDGIGLAFAAAAPALGLAVVLHAVPVALVAWRLGVERGGVRVGWATIGLVVLSTIVGYGVGSLGVGAVAERVSMGVACALGGGLLHALLHLRGPAVRQVWGSAAGVVVGIVLVGVLIAADPEPLLDTMPPLAAIVLVATALLAVLATGWAHKHADDTVGAGAR